MAYLLLQRYEITNLRPAKTLLIPAAWSSCSGIVFDIQGVVAEIDDILCRDKGEALVENFNLTLKHRSHVIILIVESSAPDNAPPFQ